MEQITSFQNSKIKLANKLVSKRQREKNGLFLIDDARDLTRALACRYEVEYALYCPELADNHDAALIEKLDDATVYEISADLTRKASYRQNPGGIVAIMRQQAPRTVTAAQSVMDGHVLALVDLRKPGNIGALLRTADAAGIAMICLIDSSLDLYNPNVIRASTGAVFLGNIYEMSTADALTLFDAHNLQIIAAHLAGERSLYDVDFNAQRAALVMGTEDTGLDDLWVKRCDSLVKIPMVGDLSDSLNVSVSGALFMYEALRQRLAQT